MNPNRNLEPGIQPPFQFAYRGDLLEEMCIDDAFITMPASEAEAIKTGRLYGKVFDQSRPMESIEKILKRRTGKEPSKRFVMGFVIFRGETTPTFYVQDELTLRVPVEMFGPLTGLYQKLERLLRERGLSTDVIRSKLYVTPIAEDSESSARMSRWIVGYERGTGECALFQSDNAGVLAVKEFMKGTTEFAPFDLNGINSLAK